MKKQVAIKCLIVVFLFNIFAISLGLDSFKALNQTESNSFQINMGSIHSPINITGNNDFTIGNGVSSGAGTYEEPYIIRDFIIEVDGPQNCIFINNTDVFFKIENCTLKNSGSTVGKTTINLNNVSNGLIFNNDISLAGIHLTYSHYNNITYNNLIDCEEIYLFYSNNNNFLQNYIRNSTFGITFRFSNDNTIEGNEIYDCSNDAIGIWSTSNNNIIRNNWIFNNGGKTGEDQIDIDFDCIGTSISGNIYAYRFIGDGIPWLLILIIILIVSAVVASIAIIFAYRRYRKIKDTKHPEPPEPLDTTDLW